METSSKKVRNAAAIVVEEPSLVNIDSKLDSVLAKLHTAECERVDIRREVAEFSKAITFLNTELDELKKKCATDKGDCEKRFHQQELLIDQLQFRDRSRSLRLFNVPISREEEQDNKLLAQRIHHEIVLPALTMDKYGESSAWWQTVEFAHKVAHRKSDANSQSYHIIFKLTSRYLLHTIFNNRATILQKLNEKTPLAKAFLQKDCTEAMKSAMQYLRSSPEVNEARVFLNASGNICFHRHGAQPGSKPEICKNYMRRPLAEMIAN